MEIFTEIRFEVSEFDKIDKVLYVLTNEGWEIEETKEYSLKRPNQPKQVTSKKYKLKRKI